VIQKQTELAIKAERSLIEELISSGSDKAIIDSGLSEQSFRDKGYGALFAVIQKVGCTILAISENLAIMKSGQQLNSIKELAKQRGVEVDGLPIDLTDGIGTPGAVEEAVRQVKHYAMLRNVANGAELIFKAATADGANPEELLLTFQNTSNVLQKRSTELALSAGEQSLPSLNELAPELLKQRDARLSGVGNVPIGLSPISDALGGFWWPGVHVLLATPKAGKTQFVLQEAVNAAKEGSTVAYLSLELGPLEVEARVLGILENELFTNILTRQTDKIKALQEKHCDTLSRFRIFGGAGVRLTPDNIRESAKSLRAMDGEGSCFMIVDYLQKMGGKTQGEPRERVSEAADYLHTYGELYSIPILAVSTVGRVGYRGCSVQDFNKPGSPDSLMGLGKESGDIEYSAQSLLAIVHQRNEDGTIKDSRIALAASRRGASKWIKGLAFKDDQWVDTKEREAANIKATGFGL
jgi:replicative DNA helicase